ncbi:hypothetical protein [Sphaerisporangium rhizosphaerae]|uniref:Uncharacterized protein n=1 Tax=Sphaerisporangium rhizosphaerae TaxID=2269375 RepID=A0ABW2PCT0_9ACTN
MREIEFGDVIWAGICEPARRMADSIITSQSAEIGTTRKLLR